MVYTASQGSSAAPSLVSQSAHARTLRELRQMIVSGVIPRGEVLPSERDLSDRLGVARRTVRKALAALSEEGLLTRPAGNSPRTVASAAAAPTGAPWVSKAVIVLVPGEDTSNMTVQRGRWLRYATLGSFDAVRSAGLHSIGLNISTLNDETIGQLAGAKPQGVLIPDVLGFMGQEVERRIIAGLDRAGVPLVVYGGGPDLANYDRVCSGHEHGSYELTRHLISLGRNKIRPCWAKPWDRYWFNARRAGYEKAMFEAGLTPLPTAELPELMSAGRKTDFSADDFRRESRLAAGYLAEVLIGDAAADALMVGTDRELPFVSAGCRLLGKEPGKDVLLAGYDNYFDGCEEQAFEPTIPVATVDKDNEAAGGEMVRLLIDRVAGRLPSEAQVRTVNQRLVVPIGDDLLRT